jgi:1-phosphatidylinositol-4-phosphate 5-kinase
MARRQATHIEGPTVYYLGVIDILQEWTWAKRFERWAKVWLQNADRDGLSAMPPANYLPRFQVFKCFVMKLRLPLF